MFLHPLLMTSALVAPGGFKTFGYTGSGASHSFTTPGFKPDLVMLFNASAGTSYRWPAFDSSNGSGISNDMCSFSKGIAIGATSLTSFDTLGFTLGSNANVNTNGRTYQAFCWQKGDGRFDVQKFTGNNTARTISHGLGIVPKMIFAFDNLTSGNTALYHVGMDATSPQNYNMNWSQSTVDRNSSSALWNNTAPTTTDFSLGTSNIVNATGDTCTAYLFGEVTGESAFGTYIGNGLTIGPAVITGFQPSVVMLCKQLASGNEVRWIYGNNLSGKINEDTNVDATNYVDLTATGFSIKTSIDDFNTSGAVYFYAAWL